MTDFLLELRSEEIPARMQAKAREDLARLFAAELAKAGLAATETVTYATPRRLALIAKGLPDATEAVSEEVKGPRASAPPQALEGFLRKTGLTREQLTERDGVLFAVTEKPGRATAAVIAEAIPAVIRNFPWPKSMRWGDASRSTESLRWVRPLQGIVALFGEEVVPVSIAGVESGAATVGHRFHHPGVITIGSAGDYVEKLRACHVVVDQDERQSIIALGATMATAKAGLTLIRDEGLLAENAGLTEWPVPLLGRFDAAFLDVPPEVIQLTARVNQKYFVCQDGAGKLANAFVCTANIDAADGGAKIVDGNRKVLAARLSDARFFCEQDLKIPLEEQARKLDKIVFHEKLGTVADKVDRVAKLARWLVESGVVPPSPPVGEEHRVGHAPGMASTARGAVDPALGPLASASGKGEADVVSSPPPHPSAASGGSLPLPQGEREQLAQLAERAARLCKADLVTGMVGEFPELQGLMGGYYAAARGEDPRVAAAIRDHYKPVGQGDDVPTDPVTVAVSLADKLDTIVAFFTQGLAPTGSKDPFAVRRSALAVLSLILKNNLRLPQLAVFSEINRAFTAPNLRKYAGPHWPLDRYERRITSYFDGASWHQNVDLELSEENQDQLLAFVVRHDFLYAATASDGTQARDVRNTFSWGHNNLRVTLLDFFADRLKVQQREAGVRHDLIDAVFALGGEDDLVRLLARVRALQAFVTTDDGANLLAGYKRAANILKKEGYEAPLPLAGGAGGGQATIAAPAASPPPTPPASGRGEGFTLSYTPEKDEAALVAALDVAEPAAANAVAREDFGGAMAALASLRAPIDAFFDSVTVNDPDADKRAARLALLARVRAAVHAVADFSKIEG